MALSGVGPADPQLDAMTDLLGTGNDPTSRERVRVGLLILPGLVFEVASGLGLYVVTLP